MSVRPFMSGPCRHVIWVEHWIRCVLLIRAFMALFLDLWLLKLFHVLYAVLIEECFLSLTRMTVKCLSDVEKQQQSTIQCLKRCYSITQKQFLPTLTLTNIKKHTWCFFIFVNVIFLSVYSTDSLLFRVSTVAFLTHLLTSHHHEVKLH